MLCVLLAICYLLVVVCRLLLHHDIVDGFRWLFLDSGGLSLWLCAAALRKHVCLTLLGVPNRELEDRGL